MDLVTDIETIRRLAAEKEDASWRFRSFLKYVDLDSSELDTIVHKLYERVSAEIDCKACAQCCRVMQPLLQKQDIERLAARLSLTVGEFESEYLKMSEEEGEFTFKSTPCPFLSENSCTVYSDRPADCQSYPHLHKMDFVTRLYDVLHNCTVCPIVYNVFELLKEEFHEDRQRASF